jgi:hypothetical protein
MTREAGGFIGENSDSAASEIATFLMPKHHQTFSFDKRTACLLVNPTTITQALAYGA